DPHQRGVDAEAGGDATGDAGDQPVIPAPTEWPPPPQVTAPVPVHGRRAVPPLTRVVPSEASPGWTVAGGSPPGWAGRRPRRRRSGVDRVGDTSIIAPIRRAW